MQKAILYSIDATGISFGNVKVGRRDLQIGCGHLYQFSSLYLNQGAPPSCLPVLREFICEKLCSLAGIFFFSLLRGSWSVLKTAGK
jgi:hypothetical protein